MKIRGGAGWASMALSALLMTACASQPETSTSSDAGPQAGTALVRAPRSAGLVFLSPELTQSAAERSLVALVGPEYARNDYRLGAPGPASDVEVVLERDSYDRQYIFNGSSTPTYRQTQRSYERSSR